MSRLLPYALLIKPTTAKKTEISGKHRAPCHWDSRQPLDRPLWLSGSSSLLSNCPTPPSKIKGSTLLFITSWAIRESQEVFVTFPIPHCLCSPKYSLNDAGQPWHRHIRELDLPQMMLLWDALRLKAGRGWLWGTRAQDYWPLLPSNCAASTQQACWQENTKRSCWVCKRSWYPTADIKKDAPSKDTWSESQGTAPSNLFPSLFPLCECCYGHWPSGPAFPLRLKHKGRASSIWGIVLILHAQDHQGTSVEPEQNSSASFCVPTSCAGGKRGLSPGGAGLVLKRKPWQGSTPPYPKTPLHTPALCGPWR